MGLLAIQFPDHRRTRDELKCGVIYAGSRLANGFKELGHEAEAVCGGIEKGANVNRRLNLLGVSIKTLSVRVFVAHRTHLA